MPDVVITEFMDTQAVEGLSADLDVLYDPDLADDRARLLEEISQTVALVVRNRTVVDAEVLDSAPRLQMVARLGVGLDNIALDLCEARGIEVAPAVGANAIAVAEYVIGALLAMLRGVFGLTEHVSLGRWPRKQAVGRELAGRRLGLVGYGLIAREVAARTSSLGMRVAAYDPYLPEEDEAWSSADRVVDLEELMASCDAISIHVPLTDATAGLIDSEMLDKMRRDAVLVNTARGGIVDEAAVVTALNEGRLRGAALDVFSSEPLDAAAGSRFADVPNLILTPHVAGITEESEVRIGAMTAASVRRALEQG